MKGKLLLPIGTAEIESALVANTKVAEAAIVGYPHDIKGQGIYAYVILKNDFKPSLELEKELISTVEKMIGKIGVIKASVLSEANIKMKGKFFAKFLQVIKGFFEFFCYK